MRALDLFCKAGGATKGLQRAGFHVTGVDIETQPNYCGDAFFLHDALLVDLYDYDFIWASPPCQAYTSMRHLGKRAGEGAQKLIEPIRRRLSFSGIPYVIENVVGAPLLNPIRLCGSSFGLGVRRHRIFESSFPIGSVPCAHAGKPRPIAVYGDHPQQPGDKTYRVNRARTLQEGRQAMGIDWMNWRELTQAVPPAYSQYIAEQWKEHHERTTNPN